MNTFWAKQNTSLSENGTRQSQSSTTVGNDMCASQHHVRQHPNSTALRSSEPHHEAIRLLFVRDPSLVCESTFCVFDSNGKRGMGTPRRNDRSHTLSTSSGAPARCTAPLYPAGSRDLVPAVVSRNSDPAVYNAQIKLLEEKFVDVLLSAEWAVL